MSDNSTTGDATVGITSDTSLANDWRSTLPEQLRDAPYFKNAKSLEQARQEIDNAAYWQGNSILKPGANASDEAKAANRQKLFELYGKEIMPIPDPYSEDAGLVFQKMGKPDAADKYKFPDGYDIDPDEAGLMKAIALDANLTQAQFEKQQGAILAKRKELADQRMHELQTGVAALQGEWGATFEGNLKRISTLVATDPLIPPHIKAQHEAGTLDAHTLRWLDSIVKKGDEVTEIPGQQAATSVMTPDQGKQEASELRARLFKMNELDPMRPILMKKLLEAERYSIGQSPH